MLAVCAACRAAGGSQAQVYGHDQGQHRFYYQGLFQARRVASIITVCGSWSPLFESAPSSLEAACILCVQVCNHHETQAA